MSDDTPQMRDFGVFSVCAPQKTSPRPKTSLFRHVPQNINFLSSAKWTLTSAIRRKRLPPWLIFLKIIASSQYIFFLLAKMKVKVIESTIKGYHVHRIRPHQDIDMLVKPVENEYDKYAMGVWMPNLSAIPVSLHESITRPAKRGSSTQKVKDIAGLLVGQLPANLGKVFHDLLPYTKSITCKSVGDPIPSKKPPPDQKFEKSECGGYDRRGGGVIIPSIYVLDVVEGKTDYVVRELHNFTKNYDGCTERVIVENTSDSCPF